jgi:hypothetical protein
MQNIGGILGYFLLAAGIAMFFMQFLQKQARVPWGYVGALVLTWGLTLLIPLWIGWLGIAAMTLVVALFVQGLTNNKTVTKFVLIAGGVVTGLVLLGVGVQGALAQVQTLWSQFTAAVF